MLVKIIMQHFAVKDGIQLVYLCIIWNRHNLSTEEIVQNGKRWMSEEVMLAFEKYIEGKNEFRVCVVSSVLFFLL